MTWNRKLWGVEFSSAGRSRFLIGSLWHRDSKESYEGAPTRTLLFCTRAQARAWCAGKNAESAARDSTDICRSWHFRPVRVRETVRLIPKGAA